MELRALEEVERINNLINVMSAQRKIKTLKKRLNPFDLYDEQQFRMKYRFSKKGVLFLNQIFGRSLIMDARGGGLSSIQQILIALRYWGRNQIQDDAADIHGLTQQSVSKVCRRVARAILEKKSDYIKIPNHLNEQLRVMQDFESIAGFKNVVGAIDCTHINSKVCRRVARAILEKKSDYIKIPNHLNEQLRVMQDFESIAGFKNVVGAIDCTHIKVPKVNGHSGQYYINRKGYSSLNIQAVCDARLKIRNIVARWRGSTHDSRIFSESLLKQSFESGQFYGRLLGDSGYACTPYLFTPLLNPTTRKTKAYNFAHIRTRNVIERCFGVWKNRFRCLLTGFRTSLENTKMFIIALAVLHNIAIELNEENFPDEAEHANYLAQPPAALPPGNTLRGAAVRATFIEEHF